MVHLAKFDLLVGIQNVYRAIIVEHLPQSNNMGVLQYLISFKCG